MKLYSQTIRFLQCEQDKVDTETQSGNMMRMYIKVNRIATSNYNLSQGKNRIQSMSNEQSNHPSNQRWKSCINSLVDKDIDLGGLLFIFG